MFMDCHNVVSFIDGKMFTTIHSDNPLKQNKEYNAWKCDCFSKMVLVWDTDGYCIDAGVNFPVSFHDHKISHWCGIYDHI